MCLPMTKGNGLSGVSQRNRSLGCINRSRISGGEPTITTFSGPAPIAHSGPYVALSSSNTV